MTTTSDSNTADTGADIPSLSAELEQVRQRITELEQYRESLETIIRIRNSQTAPQYGFRAPAHPGRHAKRSALGETATIADYCEVILDELGGPLHVNQLHAGLEARRVHVTRKNLLNILNRWVRAGARFERPRPNTFARLRGPRLSTQRLSPDVRKPKRTA